MSHGLDPPLSSCAQSCLHHDSLRKEPAGGVAPCTVNPLCGAFRMCYIPAQSNGDFLKAHSDSNTATPPCFLGRSLWQRKEEQSGA